MGKENTTIIDGVGAADIEARVKQIRIRSKKPPRLRPRKAARARGQLAGGVAVIKVGAATEVEMKERRPAWKMPARHPRAVKKALWPVVAWPLLRASSKPPGIKGDNADQDARHCPWCEGHRSPLREIVYNAGGEASVVVNG